jgi:hypothetical protein
MERQNAQKSHQSGAYSCVPFRRVLELEADLAEELQSRGTELSLAYAPSGTPKNWRPTTIPLATDAAA